MQQLKRIVACTSCNIVISSTWRETPVSLRALLLQLQQAGISPSHVIDSTPVLGARAAEIVEWLQLQRKAHARYCVLDDWDVCGSGFDVARLVRCDSAQGLTEERADAAIAMLMGGEGV